MLPINLRLARKRKKLTQEELAKKVNTTKGTISNYENGYSSPSIEMLNMLANILETSTDFLTGRSSNIEKVEQGEINTNDPDDEFFLHGYLEASDEDKRKMRKYFYEMIRERGRHQGK